MLLKKRRLIFPSSITAIVILVVILILPLRNYLIDSLGWPLNFLSYINREIQGAIFYHQNLVENQLFKKEIGLMRRQIYEVEELYFENVRLRGLLDFKKKSIYPLTAASVIGHDPSNLSAIVIIDKGKQQRVKKGFAVITNDGLVGRVVQVGNSTSKVLLINDINSGVAAFLQRSRQKGLVSGTLAEGLIFHYLPPNTDIQISDLVITSGLSGIYPKGILIGKVVKIQRQEGPRGIFAIVEPSANLTTLEEVLVVLSE